MKGRNNRERECVKEAGASKRFRQQNLFDGKRLEWLLRISITETLIPGTLDADP